MTMLSPPRSSLLCNGFVIRIPVNVGCEYIIYTSFKLLAILNSFGTSVDAYKFFFPSCSALEEFLFQLNNSMGGCFS
jgi:hypothetical protein